MRTLIAFLLANALLVLTAPPEISLPIALTTDNVQGDEDSCLQYSRCSIQGKFYWSKLIANLAISKPVDKPSTLKIFDTYYGASHERRNNAGQEIEQDLINHGMSPIDDYQKWNVFSLPDGDVEDSAYQNLFNTNDGVIIATSNFRKEDMQKKLQWSDIVYQIYHRSLEPGQAFSDLQAVIQVDVVNTGAYNVARSAYASTGLNINADNVWRRWTMNDQRFHFYSFLGTDSVKGTVWLLHDRPNELRKKVITEIWTRFGNHFDIWLTLGPYDPSRDRPVG
ncbi:MAG: hypothetical protein L6R41_002082 [Letrouitia leprolyta]|nr:MAG: hypothetical protein L6R41_002082 [Letrouitia leprolyta]